MNKNYLCFTAFLTLFTLSIYGQTHILSSVPSASSIKKNPISGGAGSIINLSSNPGGYAVSPSTSNSYLYIPFYQGGQVWRYDLDGSNGSLWFSLTGTGGGYYISACTGSAINSTHLFIGNEYNDHIIRINLNDPNDYDEYDFGIIGAGQDNTATAFVTVTSNYMFCGGGDNRQSKNIARCDLDGSNKMKLLDANAAVLGVAADESYLYWRDKGGNIGRANHDGSNANNTWITGLVADDHWGILVNDSYLYVMYNSSTLYRYNLDGTNQTIIGNDFGNRGLGFANYFTNSTWDGSLNTDWNTADNWNIGVVPTSSHNVTIPDVSNDPVVNQESGSPAICNNLTLQSDASLTINAGKALTVNGDLTIADSKGPALMTIYSDPTGTGSLIVTGTFTGNVNFERYAVQNEWHFISAPVDGQAIDNSFMSNSGISNNPTFQFFRWDEDQDYWIIYGSTGNPEAFTDTEFGDGKGYAAVRSSDGDINFSGTVRTSNVLYAATYTAGDRAGFNLVGNPFSCALGITSSATSSGNFLAANTSLLDDNFEAAYIWDEQSSYTFGRNDYKVISNAAISGYTQLAQHYVQPGQAFMVRVNSGGGNIQFNTNMRAHASVSFYKNEELWPSVELIIEGNEMFNSTAIAFQENMTTGLDPSYDVGKMKGNPDIALYTRLVDDNGIDFAIQSLPLATMENLVVPVGVDVSSSGTFEFSAVADQMEEKEVFLEDRELSILTNLKTNTYSAIVNESGIGRFYLHFKNTTGISDPSLLSGVQAYSAGGVLYIQNPEGYTGAVKITDLAGREMMNFSLNGHVGQKHEVSGLSGIYIVNIKTNGGSYNSKVLIK